VQVQVQLPVWVAVGDLVRPVQRQHGLAYAPAANDRGDPHGAGRAAVPSPDLAQFLQLGFAAGEEPGHCGQLARDGPHPLYRVQGGAGRE
jgi:hypothetical protein